MGIVESEEDMFHKTTGIFIPHTKCYLHRIDLRQWKPGMPVKSATVYRFPKQAKGVNRYVSSRLMPC